MNHDAVSVKGCGAAAWIHSAKLLAGRSLTSSLELHAMEHSSASCWRQINTLGAKTDSYRTTSTDHGIWDRLRDELRKQI